MVEIGQIGQNTKKRARSVEGSLKNLGAKGVQVFSIFLMFFDRFSGAIYAS